MSDLSAAKSRPMQKRLGLVGLGAIGQAVVQAAESGAIPFRIAAIHHRNPESSEGFRSGLRSQPPITTLPELIELSDVVLEAASRPAVEEVCRAALPRGKDVIVLSIGALVERPQILDLARQTGTRIIAPSGGIIGLDGLKGACSGRVDAVTITTRKSPASLRNTPYVKDRHISMDDVKEATVIFDGSPLDALKGFPSNINVSAAVSLAGIGPERTRLRIIADPSAKRNIHEVEVTGEFGRSLIRVENVPAGGKGPGMLSYFSVIALLKQYDQHLIVGT